MMLIALFFLIATLTKKETNELANSHLVLGHQLIVTKQTKVSFL